jgi:Animal haem peroxidase
VSTASKIAVHPARDHCLAASRPVDAPLVGFEGRYGRMFPELPPLLVDDRKLLAVGVEGALCDAGDDCPDGRESAGWPVFGQFVAHDITADRSPLQAEADPSRIGSFRSPRANLECLYGAGPGSPYLYSRDDPASFLLGDDDVPRNVEGIALLGDARNDVHVLVSQLHVAFLRLHNLFVTRMREDGVPEAELFMEGRRATIWHYQWVIVHDFLARLVGHELVDDVLANGPRHYREDGEPFIPFEFADAAYRYGHSQMRETYRLNEGGEPVTLFPGLIGFRPVSAELTVDWAFLFDLPGRQAAQRAKRIDGRLARSLIRLPVEITGEVELDAYHSLASRDLQRGHALALPSGEAVADAIGAEPLSRDEVGLGADWGDATPLWFYVLREADVRGDGDRLGPVGGRILAEVLIGIVKADPESFLAADPDWAPTLAADMGSLLAAVSR